MPGKTKSRKQQMLAKKGVVDDLSKSSDGSASDLDTCESDTSFSTPFDPEMNRKKSTSDKLKDYYYTSLLVCFTGVVACYTGYGYLQESL